MTSSKRLLSAVLSAFILAVPVSRSLAETTPAAPAPAPVAAPAALPTSGITAEFKVIFEQITTKLKAGQGSEAELAPDVAAIDALLAKHASEKTDEVAMIALMKARLYLEVFENTDKGIALLKDIKVNFPNSEISKNIDQAVAGIEKQAAAASLLAVGKTFPAFTEKDLNDKPLALADFKGKAVLLNFWATWCAPCVKEMPSIDRLQAAMGKDKFLVLPLSLDGPSRPKVVPFYKDKDLANLGIYFDRSKKVMQGLGISILPTSILVDPAGNELGRLEGEADWEKPEAIALMKAAIGSAG